MAAKIKIVAKRKTHENFKVKTNTRNLIGDITIAQQSFQNANSLYFPVVDVSQRFEESLARCRTKKHCLTMGVDAQKRISEHPNKIKDSPIENTRPRYNSESLDMYKVTNTRRASELVDLLLLDIYGRTEYICAETGRFFDTEYGSSTSIRSVSEKFEEKLQYNRLIMKNDAELGDLICALRERVTYSGSLLVKQLKRRDALKSKEEKLCNVITAHLQACSRKRSEDTNMRFSPTPVPGDSGFNQWRDAMKMVAKLPGGIPSEFRRKLWLELSEKYLQSKGVNWSQTERLCFNEWSNPDDNELGVQIVKDLHRTGCSLFCGAAGQENQALLKRVLLAYARWNKSVGYCQGFNMLAALILQVMDKSEADSVKVMIYLIEGVLPESYFANNLRGLSVDMVVFRDLLKMRLPLLSKHLEALQNDAREGNSYEPPLTNVFTMQWFLTLFCNCLPQSTVLRVWDLIFLEGNEILLRTAIAIWEKLSDRILAVNSADEFYSIMGVLTREMLEFGLVDSNTLVKSIVAIGACPELNEMRDRYLYNITPWTQSVQSAAKKGLKLFYSDDDDVESDDEKAAVTAAYGMAAGRKRERNMSATGANLIQPYAHGHPDRERLALDISALKKQYARLRERQRQAHIILQAACARQPIGPNPTPPPIAMNHLLLGKNAIVNSRGRRLGPPKGAIPPARKIELIKKNSQGETVHWKDTAKIRYPRRPSYVEEPVETKETFTPDSDSSSYSDDDGSSTSTELCDEPDRLDDFDSDDKSTDTSKPIDKKSRASSKDMKNNRNRNKTSLENDAIKDSDTNVGELKIGVDNGVKLMKVEENVINDTNDEIMNENILVTIDNQTDELLDVEANILDNKDALHSQSSHIFDNNEGNNDQNVHSQTGAQIEITTTNDLDIKSTNHLSRDSCQNYDNEIKFIKSTSNTNEEQLVNEEIKCSPNNIKTPDDSKNIIESSNKCEEPSSEINTSESQNFFTFDNSLSSQTNLEVSPVSSYNFQDNWSNSKENIDDSSLIVENTSSMRTLHFSDQASSFEDNPLSFEESQEKLKSNDQPNLLSFEEQIEEKSKIITPDKSYSSELMHNYEDVNKKLSSNEKINDANGVQIKEEIITKLKNDVTNVNEINESINEISEDKSCDFDSFLEERLANKTSEDISCDFESFLEERLSNQKSEDKSSDFDSFLEERVKILKQNTTPSPQEEENFTWKLNEEKLQRHKSYEETVKSDLDKTFIYKQRSFDIHASPDEETIQWSPFQSKTTEIKTAPEDNETNNESIYEANLISLPPEKMAQEFSNLTSREISLKDPNNLTTSLNEDKSQNNIDNVVNEASKSTEYISQNKQEVASENQNEDINTNWSENKSIETKEENYDQEIKSKENYSISMNNQIEAVLIKPSQITKKEEIKTDDKPESEHIRTPFDKDKIVSPVKSHLFSKEEIIADEEQLKDEICSITLTTESPDTEEIQIKIDVKFIEDTKKNYKEPLTKQPSIELLTVEDKRLEAGRRNSERALKIIQENSLILHRILQHQRSSEVEDSEEELSKSPISKTFLRSESLLYDDRSSREEDEDLSATESYSISPAILDEDLEKSPPKITDVVESPERVTSLSEELSKENVFPFRNEACSNSTLEESNNTSRKQDIETAFYDEISYQITNEAEFKSSHIKDSENVSPNKDVNKAEKAEILHYLGEESSKENNKSDNYDRSPEPLSSSEKLTKEINLKIKHEILGISEEDKNNSSKTNIDKVDNTSSRKEFLKENEPINIDVYSESKEVKLNSSPENKFQSTNKTYSRTSDEDLDLPSKRDKYESEEIIKESEYKSKTDTIKDQTTDDLYKPPKRDKCESESWSNDNEYQLRKNVNIEETKLIKKDTEVDFLYTSKSTNRNTDEESSEGPKSQFQKIAILEEDKPKKIDSGRDYLYKRKYETLRNPFSPEDEPEKTTSIYSSPIKKSTTDPHSISSENEACKVSPYSSPSKYSRSGDDTCDRSSYSSPSKYLSSTNERKDSLSSYGRYQSFQEDEPVSSFQRSKEYKKRATSFDSNELELERYSPSKFRNRYTSLSSPLAESSNEFSDRYTSDKKDKKLEDTETLPVSSKNTIQEEGNVKFSNYRSKSPEVSKETYSSPRKYLDESSDDFKFTTRFRTETSKYISPEKSSKYESKEDSDIYESPRRQVKDHKPSYLSERSNSPNRSVDKSPTHLNKEEMSTFESPRRQFENTLREEPSAKYESPRRYFDDNSKQEDKRKDHSPKRISKEDEIYESPRRKFEETCKKINDSSSEIKCDEAYKADTDRYLESRFKSVNDEIDDKYRSKVDSSTKHVDEISTSGKKLEERSVREDAKYESPRRKFEDTYQEEASNERITSTKDYKTSEFEETTKYVNQISSSERQLDGGTSKKDSCSKYLARTRNEDDNNITSTDKKSSAQSFYDYPENSSDYQKFHKSNLSIDLASPQFASSYSPEVSPPKHLSCLQFTSFQTDIPCTSKTLQISPICSKEKSTSPTDTKYLPSFSLPTLSPPRRNIKSPLSPDKTFSPFPVQPTTRQPKEVGIRLGLYKDLSPLKSPAK